LEERRRGGEASGEARRKRKRRGWTEVFLDRIDADPEAFVSAFLATSNGAAQVAMLQLAQQAKRARLREREAELDERERAVRAAERDVRGFEEREEEAEERFATLSAEIDELEGRRDDLRAAIAAEAEAAGFELVEGEVGG